jgi:hypothetical protein
MAPHISRRVLLSLLTASGASLAAGTYLWTSSPEALIGKMLANRFPGVRVDAASIAALTRDIKAAPFQTFRRRLALEAGARAAVLVGINSLAQWKLTASRYYQLERKVATFFIFASNFLDVKDPRSDIVTYRGMPDAGSIWVCPNRFAEYDKY